MSKYLATETIIARLTRARDAMGVLDASGCIGVLARTPGIDMFRTVATVGDFFAAVRAMEMLPDLYAELTRAEARIADLEAHIVRACAPIRAEIEQLDRAAAAKLKEGVRDGNG